jgi:plastocyanin
MRKLLLLPLLVFALAAAAPAGASTTYKSDITAAGFLPANQTVQNGDAVTWTNDDTVNHQVVADDGSFSSDVLTPGESFTHVFLGQGTVAYHDAMAPSDKGSVTVNATRFVLLRYTHTATLKFTRSTTLKGVVSDGSSNGETVLVQAKPKGADDSEYLTVATATTTAGTWRAVVRPRENTDYRAVWNNVPSNVKTLWVKPLMKLVPATHHRLSLRVDAGVSLAGHHVLLQRRTRHGWRAYRTLRLVRLKANRTTYSAIVRFHARRGLVIRARMTHAQAGAMMYGPATSNSLRVH